MDCEAAYTTRSSVRGGECAGSNPLKLSRTISKSRKVRSALAFDFNFPSVRFFLWSSVPGIFEIIGKLESQVSGVGGVRKRGFEVHRARSNHFFDFSVKVLHSFGVT